MAVVELSYRYGKEKEGEYVRGVVRRRGKADHFTGETGRPVATDILAYINALFH